MNYGQLVNFLTVVSAIHSLLLLALAYIVYRHQKMLMVVK